jgi:DNA-binding transcriptional ArsR family regulator
LAEEIRESHIVDSAEQATVLLHPLRAEILSILSEPLSAAEVGRRMDETPQRVNYHLKALEKVGLVHQVGKRQVRNLVEVLYQALAKTFILSEYLGLGDETVKKLKDQSSLSTIVSLAEGMKKDAIALLDYADQHMEVPSASIQSVVSLPTESSREQFLNEYITCVKGLINKYNKQQEDGEDFKVTLAVYPDISEGGTTKDE